MVRTAALLAVVLALSPGLGAQNPYSSYPCPGDPNAPPPPNQEMQRQEIVNIEGETARAILLNNGTFFHRVYSDDFAGTLSHGQPVDRNTMIQVVQSADVKYQVFVATDIKVRIYRDAAVSTCLWTARGTFRGERFNSQMRVLHMYINTPQGWHIISAQHTALPPNTDQPL